MPDERHDEPDDLETPPPFFPYEGDVKPPLESGGYGEPVEVAVEAVFAAHTGDQVQHFVLLSEGDRKLPIVIGPFEAHSISMALEGNKPDRPITHDLMKTLIERLGGNVVRVLVDDIWGSTYYAKVLLLKGKEEIEIDCRPSDAIGLAVRFEAPIFVAEGILDAGGQ